MARKSKPLGDVSERVMSFRLPLELIWKLNKAADEKRMTVTQVVELALKEKLRRYHLDEEGVDWIASEIKRAISDRSLDQVSALRASELEKADDK